MGVTMGMSWKYRVTNGNVTLLYSDMSCGRYVTLLLKTESRSEALYCLELGALKSHKWLLHQYCQPTTLHLLTQTT